LRQLCWLQQIASLWEPLAGQQVEASLLDLSQLRVDQALLRLTALSPSTSDVSLVDLGHRWQSLVDTAQSAVQAHLQQISQALVAGQLTAAALVADLTQAIERLAQELTVAVDWVAYTDQGPSRQRNEDACYPQGKPHHQHLSGQQIVTEPLPLLLICDGIGGHEQGNVASHTAIDVLLKELQPLATEPTLSLTVVSQRLRHAIALANTAIVNRNDNEYRAARARMGTTLVLALVHFPYVTLAHLGDSRAYRISQQTCYQLTLDDDVAAREARLGYALYQEALHMPSAGALVQALGINDSGYLYPTIQHLLLDDASVLLLCSDGLSDNDRVEMLWPHLVQPVVSHQRDLATVGQELVHQANRLNGHDNVTVGLLRLTPLGDSVFSPLEDREFSRQDPPAPPPLAMASDPAQPDTATEPETQLVVPTADFPEKAERSPSLGRVMVIASIGLLGLLAAGLISQLRQTRVKALVSIDSGWIRAEHYGQLFYASALAVGRDVEIGSFWQITASTVGPTGKPLVLLEQPNSEPTDATTDGASPLVSAGSILKVMNRLTADDGTDWVRLQVCSIPSGASLEQVPSESDQTTTVDIAADTLNRRLATPGDTGLLPELWLYGAAKAIELTTRDQLGDCQP
jgi:serine/threonine protein phosphatase PrpC